MSMLTASGPQAHTAYNSASPRVEQPFAPELFSHLLEVFTFFSGDNSVYFSYIQKDATSYAFVYGLLFFPGGQHKNGRAL
jgi:hypothetical protein